MSTASRHVPAGIDFGKQLKRMIAFIEQEGDERAIEIKHKADEEANNYLGNYINTERIKINNYYTRREDAIDKQKIIKLSILVSRERMKILKLEVQRIDEIFREVYDRLVRDISNEDFYREVFSKLILQCLCMMMEKNVGVRIIKKDHRILKGIIPDVVDRFERMSGIRVKFEIDNEVFLDESVLGGVVMFAQAGTIKIVNTLLSRIEMLKEIVVCFLRYSLFGPNPHRRFYV